ncbi:MAG: nucleoside deaminase [Lactobacillaceae bacterium]|jgi:tRNA(Arg) A34 adenosine deaminase TadA|nr:nucleoside deaminase [Lactobacillaceae bacterium]
MNKFMRLADLEAQMNLQEKAGGPFGSVIVNKAGEVVGKGHNHVLANNDPTAHGEVMAIRDAGANLGTFDLSGCTLYTNAYPCPMCYGAIIWANLDAIYYGNDLADAAMIGFRDQPIYDFFHGKATDMKVPTLSQLDHAETIKTFEAYLAGQHDHY